MLLYKSITVFLSKVNIRIWGCQNEACTAGPVPCLYNTILDHHNYFITTNILLLWIPTSLASKFIGCCSQNIRVFSLKSLPKWVSYWLFQLLFCNPEIIPNLFIACQKEKEVSSLIRQHIKAGTAADVVLLRRSWEVVLPKTYFLWNNFFPPSPHCSHKNDWSFLSYLEIVCICSTSIYLAENQFIMAKL